MHTHTNIKLYSENTFTLLFENFQSYNRAKNLSPKTIRGYEQSKDAFLKFLGVKDFNLDSVSQDTIVNFINHCRKNGNTETTINTKLTNLRTVFNYFAEREYMPPLKIRLIKATIPVKETYTDAELKILLEKPNIKKAGFDDYRNWVIVNYLLGTGNRLSSIINIQMKDVHLADNEVVLRHTKNKTQQIVPIGTTLKSVLAEYLRYRKPKYDTDYLFCTWHGEQLTEFGMVNAIARYNQRRGIEKRSIHLFRHTFARMFILNGGDIFRLQKLLGHKNLEMVRRYVELWGQDLHRDYDKFNPLENIVTKKEHISMKG
jgi:integrase/recombinase XerD